MNAVKTLTKRILIMITVSSLYACGGAEEEPVTGGGGGVTPSPKPTMTAKPGASSTPDPMKTPTTGKTATPEPTDTATPKGTPTLEATATPEPNPGPDFDGDAKRGKVTLTDMGCTACHSDNGDGTFGSPKLATMFFDMAMLKYPSKKEHNGKYTSDTVQDLALYINDVMPPFGQESKCVGDCANDIAAYLWSYVKDTPNMSTPSPKPTATSNPTPSVTKTPKGTSTPKPTATPSSKPGGKTPTPNPTQTMTGNPGGNDDDMDGVNNGKDQCANTVLNDSVDNNGCSAIQRGDKDYAMKCAGCHGDKGQGTTAFSTPINNYSCSKVTGKCGQLQPLSTYIASDMPYLNVGGCTNSNGSTCASDIAAFMVDEFKPSGIDCSKAANANLPACKKDSDGDGVPDADDICDSKPGETVGITGCSGIKELATGDIISPQMRLTNVEYLKTVRDAFGLADSVQMPDVTLLADSPEAHNIFLNNAADKNSDFSAAVGAAQILSVELAKQLKSSCDWLNAPQRCVNQDLSAKIAKLYRVKELSDKDIAALAGVVASAKANGANAQQALETVIARALIDSRFLYKVEIGSKRQNKSPLTSAELASRLSYLLINTIPDNTMFNNLDNISAANLSNHANRLMATESYKEAVWEFIAEWLDIPVAAADADSFLQKSAIEETRRFVFHLVDNDRPFSELFDADYSFVNKTLAKHYGIAEPTNNWDKVTFPANAQRRGILTHASFLMKTGGHGRNKNVIFRGKIVFERLFCNAMSPPPEGADDKNDMVADRTVDPECKICHATVDPLGYLFDLYTDDGSKYSSAMKKGGIKLNTDIDGDYDDIPKLAAKLGQSNAVKSCFARQVYRFALGREPFEAEKASFNQVESAISGSGSINDAIKALVNSDSFSIVHAKNNVASCPAGSN